MAVDKNSVCEISEKIVVREIGEELILVPLFAGVGDLENQIFALEGTAKQIWRKIDGVKNVSQIVEELEQEYEGEHREILEDVMGLISEIEKRQFVFLK